MLISRDLPFISDRICVVIIRLNASESILWLHNSWRLLACLLNFPLLEISKFLLTYLPQWRAFRVIIWQVGDTSLSRGCICHDRAVDLRSNSSSSSQYSELRTISASTFLLQTRINRPIVHSEFRSDYRIPTGFDAILRLSLTLFTYVDIGDRYSIPYFPTTCQVPRKCCYQM